MTKDYRRLKKGNQQAGSGQRQSKSRASKRDALHQASQGVLPNRMLEAGNAAISHLLNEMSGGKPLAPATRSEMEKAFNTDFGAVRIHDNPDSQDAKNYAWFMLLDSCDLSNYPEGTVFTFEEVKDEG